MQTNLKVPFDKLSAYISEPLTGCQSVCQVQLKRYWTKRTSLYDNTRAMLLYFIQTFPPCVSFQPIAGTGQDSGHDQAWQTYPPPHPLLFLIYRGKKCPCVGSFDPRSFI